MGDQLGQWNVVIPCSRFQPPPTPKAQAHAVSWKVLALTETSRGNRNKQAATTGKQAPFNCTTQQEGLRKKKKTLSVPRNLQPKVTKNKPYVEEQFLPYVEEQFLKHLSNQLAMVEQRASFCDDTSCTALPKVQDDYFIPH